VIVEDRVETLNRVYPKEHAFHVAGCCLRSESRVVATLAVDCTIA
jgi:hypothetical protein